MLIPTAGDGGASRPARPSMPSHRAPLLRFLLAAVGLLALGAVVVGAPAEAETVDPGIAIEGWFARNKPRSPEVEVPCPPPPLPPPPTGCGPVNPGEVPAPQSSDKGAYVTASAGGEAGRSDTAGDIGWQAYQWDLLSYIGATVEEFVVTFTQAPDNKGDSPGPWPIQACNIIAPFGAAPGSNPWPDRPTIEDSTCVVPKVEGRTFTFDLTRFAQTWVKSTGYGIAIVPGTPTQRSGLPPFQITFAGYATNASNRREVVPKVRFTYTPAAGFDFDAGGGFGSLDAGVDLGSFDGGGFTANPSIDVFPNDVGSAPLTDTTAASPAPTSDASPRVVRPATSRDPGFPWYGWLLLPLALGLFLGTGTALGPAGDPVLPRRGGLSRLIERRRAAATTQGD